MSFTKLLEIPQTELSTELDFLPKLATQDDFEGEENDKFEDEPESQKELQKDETEEELERLVFGDKAGFKDAIQNFNSQPGATGEQELSAREDEHTLTAVSDADLYFLDSGPARVGDAVAAAGPSAEEVNASGGRLRPAWEDSEDERMNISLLSVPRLRKLRHFEGEDVISGKDYIRRLRRQFELLHPAPEWAKWSQRREQQKRRRRSSHAESVSSDGRAAASDGDGEDSDVEFSTQPLADLLRSNEPLNRTTRRLPNNNIRFRQEVIEIERMKDISPTQPSAITSLAVHPSMPLIVSSGLSSTIYLHHLQPHSTPPDPPNALITSLYLKDTPLTTVAFSPNSTRSIEPQIYMSSRRRYFHVWNLPTGVIRKVTRVYGHQDSQRTMEVIKPSPCGRYLALLGSSRKGGGVINVLDASTLQWSAQVRVDSRKGVADFAWWADGAGICIAGRSGEVSEWSVEQKKIVARWLDDGAVETTVLALGAGPPRSSKKATVSVLGPDTWVAIGSASGIVNIYNRSAWSGNGGVPLPKPLPTKILENLTTSITHLAFSPCGQILAMSSNRKRDALKLVHLPSCTVYRNWPTSKTPLGRVSALTFGEYSESGGSSAGVALKNLVLCVGNEAGTLRAWVIRG